MELKKLGNGVGPQHVKVRMDDGSLVSPPQFGDSEADREEIQRRNREQVAECRAEDIAGLAALIREVDGDHVLGAAALAEALVDRGVRVRTDR